MDFQVLSTAYTGATAVGYDARRSSTAKWRSEHTAVSEFLRVNPTGSTVLDIPVGTGRFLELYRERGLKVAGRDISPDMLKAAREKLSGLGPMECSLELADIRSIPDADEEYDCVLSIRFLNWVDANGLEEALRELRRVSKRYLIVTIRHKVPVIDLLTHGPKGFRRLLMRHALRLRKSNGPRTILHERDVVLGTFKKLGLRIDAVKLLEHGRDGTDFCCYRLIRDES